MEGTMKIDKFTKVVLLVIAVFLGIVALKPLVQIETVSAYPGDFEYVKPIGMLMSIAFFLDTRNGDIWGYDLDEGKIYYSGKLVKLGKPLVKKKK